MYAHTCTHIYIYIYIYTHMHVHAYLHAYSYASPWCVCVCLRLYVGKVCVCFNMRKSIRMDAWTDLASMHMIIYAHIYDLGFSSRYGHHRSAWSAHRDTQLVDCVGLGRKPAPGQEKKRRKQGIGVSVIHYIKNRARTNSQMCINTYIHACCRTCCAMNADGIVEKPSEWLSSARLWARFTKTSRMVEFRASFSKIYLWSFTNTNLHNI